MKRIYPVILAGGMGSRLWPLSRKSFPKQFVRLNQPLSFFQQAVLRGKGEFFEPPVVLTNDQYRFIVKEQLAEIGTNSSHILIEPVPKSTAPAVLVAALQIKSISPESYMLVMPSDHHIPDADQFRCTIQNAIEASDDGNLVTWGSTPDCPETAYGYLEISKLSKRAAVPLKRFVEKPTLENAKSMFNSTNYLWNMGIFLFTIEHILQAFKQYSPNMYHLVNQSMGGAWRDLDFIRIPEKPWSEVEDISIDYAIMEKATNLSVIPYKGLWSDCGCWGSVDKVIHSDPKIPPPENDTTIAIDCNNVMLRSESVGQTVVGIGLNNIAVVAMSDAVLVAEKTHTNKVREAVEEINRRGCTQSIDFPISYRPWGCSENLSQGENFRLNRIFVNPGHSITMQTHQHRSEHWTVIKGIATVTINNIIQTIASNQSISIPQGMPHQLANEEMSQLELIEVQTGTYFGEDDVQRI